MDTNEVQEYKELSKDRRCAIDIFLKGCLFTAGLIAFGLKLLKVGQLAVGQIEGTTMDTNEVQEYKELSKDRRCAIDIFLKGCLFTAGLIAFGLKLLMESKNLLPSVFIGSAGGMICLIAIIYWVKCKNHDRAIHKRLGELASKLGFAPIISTHYCFNVVLLAGAVVALCWFSMAAWTIMKLTP